MDSVNNTLTSPIPIRILVYITHSPLAPLIMITVLHNNILIILCLLGWNSLFAQDTLPFYKHTFGIDILPNVQSTNYRAPGANKYLIDVYGAYNFPYWIVKGNIGFSSNLSDLKTRDLYYRIGINRCNNIMPNETHFEPGICYTEGWRQEAFDVGIRDGLNRHVVIPQTDYFHYRAFGLELAASFKFLNQFALRPSCIIGAVISSAISDNRIHKGISGFGILSFKGVDVNPTFISLSLHLTYSIHPAIQKKRFDKNKWYEIE